MTKFFMLTLLIGTMATAQVEPVPEGNPSSPSNVENPGADATTIVEPTPAQKATVKEAAKKAKKNAKQSDTTLAPAETAPPVSAAPTATPAVKKDAFESSNPHRFGVHADLNVPHVLNYGVDYWHSSRWFSGAFNLGGYGVKGIMKTSDTPNGIDFKISNQEAVLRLHPFRGSFYAGLGYGTHTMDIQTKRTISVTVPPGSADVEIIDEIKANYLLPHVGWLWSWPLGITFGMDIGYLSPVSPTVDLKTNITNISNPAIQQSHIEATDEYKNARADIIEQSERLGKSGLPYWTVFRIGYMF